MTRILISSTEDTAVHALDSSDSSTLSALISFVPIQKEENSKDIRTYIDAELSKRKQLSVLPGPLKIEITQALQEKAHGVFRWVQCQLDHLSDRRRTRTVEDVQNALEGLPATLEQTYEQILKRIDEEGDANLVGCALLWLCFSFKAMTVADLVEAIRIPIYGGEVTYKTRLLNPEQLLRDCSSLISYRTSSYQVSDKSGRYDYIVLGHSSVREYLTSDKLKRSSMARFYINKRHADTILSKLCLNYLLQKKFASGCNRTHEGLMARMRESPLLEYLKNTLWDHLSYVDVNGPLRPQLSRFLDSQRSPGGGNFGSWVQTYYRRTDFRLYEQTTPLYFAAREGLLSLVKMIIAVDGTKDLERRGGRNDSTPLHVAAWSGHTRIVKELLAAGANVREQSSDGMNGLYYAVVRRHSEVERLLRDAGAVLNEEQEKRAQQWEKNSGPGSKHINSAT